MPKLKKRGYVISLKSHSQQMKKKNFEPELFVCHIYTSNPYMKLQSSYVTD